MKILLINSIYGSRSSGKSLLEIKDDAEREGHKVYVATPNIINEDWHYRIGNSFDHKIHALLSRITGLQAYYSTNATKRLCDYIDKIQPDIVHIQVVHGNYLNYCLLLHFLAEKSIPLVIVLDDCWHFTGKCCHFIANHCYRWQYECGKCPRWKLDNPSWFFDRSAKMLRDKKEAFSLLKKVAVVAVSDWLLNQAQQSFLNNATVLKRIYNSVDLELFRPSRETEKLKNELGLAGKHVILGVATDWQDKIGLSKGIKLFVELSGQLPKDHSIVLIGNPSPDVLLPKNIYSVPFVSRPEKLSEFYSMSDVFVQMSSEETFGKVTAEALSCGTPVVVFNKTANPELVGPGCGMVVDDKNVVQVKNAVEKIISNGKNTYLHVCRNYAKSNFNARFNAKKYLELYQELILK